MRIKPLPQRQIGAKSACFSARQECFESRHFEVKRNGGVRSVLARDFMMAWQP
jgi:hypothetical protein